MLRAMRNAGASYVPLTQVYQGMSTRSGAETSAGDGGIVALALRQQFLVCDNVLEQVEVFKHLGCLLAQDDDDIQTICTQMQKAQATWAQVRQVLWSENASPFVAARFYQAIIQAILLYGSKSWIISRTAMARLEGLHIFAAYRMAKEH